MKKDGDSLDNLIIRDGQWYRYSKENRWELFDDYLVRVYQSAQTLYLNSLKIKE